MEYYTLVSRHKSNHIVAIKTTVTSIKWTVDKHNIIAKNNAITIIIRAQANKATDRITGRRKVADSNLSVPRKLKTYNTATPIEMPHHSKTYNAMLLPFTTHNTTKKTTGFLESDCIISLESPVVY